MKSLYTNGHNQIFFFKLMIRFVISSEQYQCLMLLLPCSPAEELYFGSTDSGEKKALIVLTNVTKNIVAFKVNIWEIIYKLCVEIERLIILSLHVFMIFLGLLNCLLALSLSKMFPWGLYLSIICSNRVLSKLVPGFNVFYLKKNPFFSIWIIRKNEK